MTPNKEDYLKNILELGGDVRQIPNKELVASLSISPASVSEMIRKLMQEGYVEHTPYQGIQLTETGIRKASTLIRKHRIWETFLVRCLDYKLDEVHDEAEILEHAASERLIERLEIFLDFPETCPHGGMIPRKGGLVKEKTRLSLVSLEPGTEFLISRLVDDRQLLEYLASKGIGRNKTYHLLKTDKFEGDVQFKDDENFYSIGPSAAQKIYVKKIDTKENDK